MPSMRRSIRPCLTTSQKVLCRLRGLPAYRWCSWSTTTFRSATLRNSSPTPRPIPASIASSGIGTSLHLSGELFKAMAGVQFTHVPYRGSAPGLTDVMSGHIQGMFDNVTSSFELVRTGKLRALGVTTAERSETMPDVPPIADTLAGFETSSFYGVGAPAGTPPDIVDLLNREIN